LMAQLPKERQYEITHDKSGPSPLFLDAEDRQVIYDLGCGLNYSLNEYLGKAGTGESGEQAAEAPSSWKLPMRIRRVPKKGKKVRMSRKSKKMRRLSEQLKRMKLSPIPEEDSD
jgi:hypothetical protein